VRRNGRLESIRVATREEKRATGRSVFIFIGAAPNTDWLPEAVMRDPNGLSCPGRDLLIEGRPPKGWTEDRAPYLLETSVPGNFCGWGRAARLDEAGGIRSRGGFDLGAVYAPVPG
jgi:thioredoxin reductase (NADPH)